MTENEVTLIYFGGLFLIMLCSSFIAVYSEEEGILSLGLIIALIWPISIPALILYGVGVAIRKTMERLNGSQAR